MTEPEADTDDLAAAQRELDAACEEFGATIVSEHNARIATKA